MLIKFQVKNFGPIKDTQTLSMEASSDTDLEDYYVCKINKLRILKLAVIYGPNASGKTTILKALDFLKILATKAKIQKSDKLDFLPFWFDDNSRNEPSWMCITFIQDTIKYEYEITFNQNCILEEKLFYYPKNRKVLFFSRTTDVKNKVSIINREHSSKLTSKNIDIIEANTLWNEPVLASFNKSNTSSKGLENAISWFTNYLQNMTAPNSNLLSWASDVLQASLNNESIMTELVRKADIQIDKLEIISTETVRKDVDVEFLPSEEIKKTSKGLVVESGRKVKLPISEMVEVYKELFFYHKVKNLDGSFSSHKLGWGKESHGTIRYYGLTAVLTVLIKLNTLCPIDEIETSLHPDLMKHFILTFLTNAKQSQLIVTTHNIFFLENQDILRKDVIKFTEKKEDGSTELYALSDFDPAIFRKNPSFLTAYKIGKLGAKPNLGDYYIDLENEQK